MIHIIMLSLTTISILTTLKALTFTQLLKCNIHLANHPDMQPYQDETQIATIKIASKYLNTWNKIVLPSIFLSIINIIYIWISFANEQPLPQEYLILSTILISSSLTYIMRFDIFPIWLTAWITLLMSIKKEIELDYILQQLKLVKHQLQNHINGNITLSDSELNQLKNHGLLLHQISEQYKQ